MRKYEIMVLVDSDIDERQVPGLIEKHLEVITAGGGTVDNVDHWGRRRLAYDINKKSEASYAVMQVTCDPPDGHRRADRPHQGAPPREVSFQH